MIRMIKISLISLVCFSLQSSAHAADSNWRLYISFIQESIGSVNRLPRSYQLAWVRRDSKEKELGKAFKTARKASILGTKHKMRTREVTTNSIKFAGIYDYAKMRNMWKGGPKKLNSLTLKKGKSRAKLDAQILKDAAKYKYLGFKLVYLFDMQASKAFLNSQVQNPYFGPLPIAKPKKSK